jgi:DNA-binding MarR family transcriptional regulator
METVPVAFAEFGQTLAFTERTLSAVLHHHLAERSVAPETWYALKLIAGGGGQVARRSLIEVLEGSSGLDPDSVQALLAQLEADGLIEGEDVVELTDEGSVQFANLQDYVLGATRNLLSEFDRRDVETTVRTLKAITLRANERPESAT